MQRSGKMVGRTAERAALQAALDRAIEDRVPQAVSVIGGAGIGKSRLLEEFVQQVRQEHPEARVYRAACRADGPAFAVIQRVLRARFGVVEGADAEASARSFREAVSEALGDRRVTEFLHFLGAYLDLRFPDSPFIQAVEEDPQHFALISRAVLRRFFEVEAAERPLVLVFDDLHHAQDDTLELLRYLVEALHDVPILLVFGARPELFARTQTWAEGWSNHRRIELSPLGADDTGSLVLHLLDDADEIPTELVDAVVDVAAGSPYLVEQVLRSFFAAGVLARDPQGRVRVHAERLEEAQLPLTVEDAISARISALAAG
ncbi:MAG: AAA family ATPase, partial [Myxococcales bacterium]|nr:AAA family ATPase [Myxococcales bacterium]